MLIVDPDTAPESSVVGQTPPPPAVVFLDPDTDLAVDLAGLSLAAVLVDPAGLVVNLGPVATPEDTTVMSWTWPGPFLVSGIHRLDYTVDDEYVTAALVVEAGDGWLDMATARRLWPDAPNDDLYLFILLASAQRACTRYLGALWAVGMPVLPDYLKAQLDQARALWTTGQVSPQAVDTIGLDSYAIRVYPLDHNIRQLLKPHTGKPVMW